MSIYFIYVHVPQRLAPEMRMFTADDQEDLVDAVKHAVHEWPHYDKIEVYDDANRRIMELGEEESRPFLH